MLDTPDNPISVGFTLSTFVPQGATVREQADAVSFIGSMLFARCVSGARTVPPGRRQEVGGIVFEGYGAHMDRQVPQLRRRPDAWLLTCRCSYPVPYLTAAASLGMTQADVDAFCSRLGKVLAEARKRNTMRR